MIITSAPQVVEHVSKYAGISNLHVYEYVTRSIDTSRSSFKKAYLSLCIKNCGMVYTKRQARTSKCNRVSCLRMLKCVVFFHGVARHLFMREGWGGRAVGCDKDLHNCFCCCNLLLNASSLQVGGASIDEPFEFSFQSVWTASCPAFH